MEPEISKFERILLFFNATCAKSSSVFTVWKDSVYVPRYGSYAGLLIFIVAWWEYPGSFANKDFEGGKFILVIVSVAFLALEIFYNKKIDVLWQNYYKYYNRYLFYIFILLQIGCIGFIVYKMYEKI